MLFDTNQFIPNACHINELKRAEKESEQEKLLEPLSRIAKSAEEQAKAASIQAELAMQQAKEAKKASKGANFRSYLSIAIAILSLMVSMLANADAIVQSIQKIISLLK